MKKTLKISLIVMILFFVFAVTNTVFAVEVSTMEELRNAVEGYIDEEGNQVPPASEVTLTTGFEISGESPVSTRSTKPILSITDSIVINGNGNTLTANSLRSMFDIYDNAGKDIVVTFNNITLVNKTKSARCIDMRDSENAGNITLNLSSVTLDTSAASPNAQALTVGGNYTNTDFVNITNSTINAGKNSYPVMTYNKAEISVTGSTLTGYTAFYVRGIDNSAGSTGTNINVSNSKLEATTATDHASNRFGVFSVCTTGVTINVTGTDIYSNGNGYNCLIDESADEGAVLTAGNTYTFSNVKYENTSKSNSVNYTENADNDPFGNTLFENSEINFYEGCKVNIFKVPTRILNNKGTKYTVAKSGDLYEIKKLNPSKVIDGTSATINENITANGCDGAIYAKNEANVVIDGGNIHGQLCTFDHTPDEVTKPICGYSMAVWAATKSTVTINGGTFTQDWDFVNDPTHDDLIYASGEGKIIITGGTFTSATPKWTLNCKDGSGSTITVKGGKFYKFNPATAGIKGSENYVGDNEIIVPETHKVVQNGDWYEVVCVHTSLAGYPLKEATLVEDGCQPYYECNECHKLFMDAGATIEVKDKAELVIPKLIIMEGTEAIVSDAAVMGAIQKAEDSAVVELPVLTADATVKEVTVPVASVEAVANEDKGLLIETSDVTITLDAKTVATVAEEAGEATNITIEVTKEEIKVLNSAQKDAVKDKEVEVVISAKILANGKEISDFKGGKVTIEIPFKPTEGLKASDYKFVFIDDDGKVTEIPSKYFDGVMVVELEHFSEYAIVRDVLVNDDATGSAPVGDGTTAPAPAPAAPVKDNTPKTGAISVIGLVSAMAVGGLVLTRKRK